MPACDALVVCCPAYLLSVAGRATLSCGVGGLFQRGRVMGVWTQFHVGLLLASSKTLGMKCDAASGLSLRISKLSTDVSCGGASDNYADLPCANISYY